jgi:hypothetical protein
MTYQVDWVRATLNIRNHMALEKASKKLGRNKGWLSQVSRGEVRSVGFSDGLNLLDLHCELCGREQTAALRLA